jgi:hypothetical protein
MGPMGGPYGSWTKSERDVPQQFEHIQIARNPTLAQGEYRINLMVRSQILAKLSNTDQTCQPNEGYAGS